MCTASIKDVALTHIHNTHTKTRPVQVAKVHAFTAFVFVLFLISAILSAHPHTPWLTGQIPAAVIRELDLR